MEDRGDPVDEESPALIGGEGSPDGQAPPASAKERWLKRQIVNSPFLLPGVDERRTAVATEVQMPGAGSADVVVVDAEGEITIVECKLSKNPEMRRWVIGQLFEYAAALWKLDIEDFERSLAASGTARTMPFKDPARWKEATFRNTVSRNLTAGAFRLIIAVDEITERLERTVVFRCSSTALRRLKFGSWRWSCPAPGRREPSARSRCSMATTSRRSAPSAHFEKRQMDADGQHSKCGWRPRREGLLDWAESTRLDVRYTQSAAIIETLGGRLFRISYEGEVRVSRHTLTPHGEEDVPSVVGQRTHQEVRTGPRRDWRETRRQPAKSAT